MITYSSIEIQGPSGEPVPNTFQRQDGPADHLAVLFPGAEYTVQMPVLYYPAATIESAPCCRLRPTTAGALTETERFRRSMRQSAAFDAGWPEITPE
jgi:hypothetical protein